LFEPVRAIGGDLVELPGDFLDDLAVLPCHVAQVGLVGAPFLEFLQVNALGCNVLCAFARMGPANLAAEFVQGQILGESWRRTKDGYLRHATNPVLSMCNLFQAWPLVTTPRSNWGANALRTRCAARCREA
jgi:hypothetical protein